MATYHAFKAMTGGDRAVTEDRAGLRLPEGRQWQYWKEVRVEPSQPIIGAWSRDVVASVEKQGYYLWPEGRKI
jgi:hypothetical protein